jgi:hypothetical protein
MSRSQDHEHLKLLSVFHYVVGAMSGLFSLFPIVHLVIGLLVVFSPDTMPGRPGQAPPALFGWFFVVIASMMILFGLAMSTCVLFAGRFLARRTHYTFCLVIAGMECLFMPFGTVLGVFTIVVLMRESVKPLFEASPSADPWLTERHDPMGRNEEDGGT